MNPYLSTFNTINWNNITYCTLVQIKIKMPPINAHLKKKIED